MIYADTSVIVSLVTRDIHRHVAVDLMRDAKSPVVFNRLLKLEAYNAVQLMVAAGEMTEEDAEKAENQIHYFLTSGIFVTEEPDWNRVFDRSIGLSRAHTSTIRARSFDILHVAVAAELGVRKFWTFDKRQKVLASLTGLKVNP
jgi:predicted nucleic acid-binding protein